MGMIQISRIIIQFWGISKEELKQFVTKNAKEEKENHSTKNQNIFFTGD